VEEHSIAGADFPFAATQDIPCAAEAGREFISPAEADRVRDLRAVRSRLGEGRQELVLDAESCVAGHARVKLPLILEVETLVAAVGAVGVANSILPDVIAIRAALVDLRATRKAFAPVYVKPAVGIVINHFVGDAVQRIAAFEGVLLTEEPHNVRAIQIYVVTSRHVLDDLEGVADVLESRGSRQVSRDCRA